MLGDDGCSLLAQVIAGRISYQTQQPNALELGTIQEDMSLSIDRCSATIPKGEYLIANWVVGMQLPDFQLDGSQSGLRDSMDGSVSGEAKFSFSPGHIENVNINQLLTPGDRVLIVWINDGIDPAVLSKVVSS